MAWYTGKDKIVALGLGDSNLGALATPTNTYPGLQSYNPNNRFWARDGSLPYTQSGHTWQALNHDSASRLDERVSANGANDEIGNLYLGQVLGGHGCPMMEMADVLQKGTSLPVYSCMAVYGGATSSDWLNVFWDELVTTFNDALAAIPGSPTAADIIRISAGGADLLWSLPIMLYLASDDWHDPATFVSPTAQQYYENIVELRSRMIDQGWWVPGTTQIIFGDIPRNGIVPTYPAWQGLEYVMARLNDRIGFSDFVGATYDPALQIHLSPQSYTSVGRNDGKKFLAEISPQQSCLSINGTRLSLDGAKLRTHG